MLDGTEGAEKLKGELPADVGTGEFVNSQMASFLNLFRYCCPRRNAARKNDTEEVVVEPFVGSPPAPALSGTPVLSGAPVSSRTRSRTLGRTYMDRNGFSKVVLTNKGTYLEIRRGDITWHKGQKATRHEWETLDEWRSWARKNL